MYELESPAPAPERSPSRIGPVLLLAGLAVQVCLAAILFVDPPDLDRAELSQLGGYTFHPEREAPLYLATMTGALLLLGVLSAWPHRRSSTEARKRFLASPILQSAVAAGSTAAFVGLLVPLRATTVGEPHPSGPVAVLALPVLLTLLFLVAAVRLLPGGSRPSLLPVNDAAPARLELSVWELVVPVAVFLLLYVPEGTIPSGRMFLEENNIHWDLFAMAQALTFRHGQALGGDTYSYYGAGWPLVYAGLSRWVPLTYGRMIQIGSVYLVVYMCGIYLFFRVLLRAPLRAVAGTVLVVAPCFYWLYGLYFWRAPNVTPLRWAFDVWCLLALVVHTRSGNRAWAVVAGACAGLAIVFNVHGGLELTTAVGFYFLGALLLKKPGAVRDFAYAGLTALAFVVAGLTFAGRGDVLEPHFWTGWLKEPLGFYSVPLLTTVTTPALFLFATLVFVYLTAAGWAISGAVRGTATMLEWLAGAIGVYGLMLLIKFVRYSSDQTLFRLLTPAVILLVFFGARVWDHTRVHRIIGRGLRWKLSAQAGGALVIALIFAISGERLVDPVMDYPNLLARSRGAEPKGVCLVAEPQDLCGLPADLQQPALQLQAVTRQLSDLKDRGQTFAVIDENGSLLHLATDTGPFFRYPRIFYSTITKNRVQSITDLLDSHPPDYVLMRLPLIEGTPEYQGWSTSGIGPTEDSLYRDLWDSLKQVVESGYRLESTMAPYQLWRLK